MIIDTYESIIELLKFNLSIRLSDYRLFTCNLPIQQINQNNYFITHLDFNIYQYEDYIEPNRWELLYNQINSLPYFNNFDEFIKIIINPEYNLFCNSLFSKGINRLISLKDLINIGSLNINIISTIYIISNTNIETKEHNQEILKPILYWNQITNNEQIQIIALWIIYNQVFSDANHRTAQYILERYIINIDFNFVVADFIKYATTKACECDFGMINWDNNMNNLINIVKDFRNSIISKILK
jgi:hypothetical protein